ncbi:MAG: FAD-dependent oxidoreductase [Bacillota bacterium]|nr:FAD-dependent oxidoreductase [Bacillota bacterium]
MNKRVIATCAVLFTVFLIILSSFNNKSQQRFQLVDIKEHLSEVNAPKFIQDVTLSIVCKKGTKPSSIISKAYGFKKLPLNISKYIGEPLYINTVTKYSSGKITIRYNPLLINGFDINKLIALRYDDEMNNFQVLKTTLDQKNNSLDFETSKFGEFILVENVRNLQTGEYIGEGADQLSLINNNTRVRSNVYDVVIYGGTSAGVIAACKAARLGLSVALISKDNHLGGMSSSGLSLVDVKDWTAIGGMAKEYYLRGIIYYFKKYENHGVYSDDAKKEIIRINKYKTFEPHVAEDIFKELLKEENITVVYDRLNLNNGVEVYNHSINSIKTESGYVINGRIFIDASYEGDLMAKAGVSYTVGREGNGLYNEKYNGVQYQNSSSNRQLPFGIDPYIDKNNPKLGYINGIKELDTEGGTGDKGVQAYCFRMCLTDNISNMVDYKDDNNDGIRDYVEPPKNYNKDDYELLLRYIDAEKTGRLNEHNFNKSLNTFFCLDRLPNNKIDANNCGPVSTDFIGFNYLYPNSGYDIRETIIKKQEDYQRGFLWTLQFSDDSRIPKYIKDFYKKYGLAKDEFVDNNNWPYQLYIREARRMISDYVMTEHNCVGDEVAKDSIGLASYPMDSHNVQRFARADKYNNVKYVQNEGCIFSNIYKSRFPISFKSIIPKKNECTNLLVPVAMSASHVAYGAIRMEPTFMIMAESAVAAAKIAIEENSCIVQNVAYTKLKKDLTDYGQILE